MDLVDFFLSTRAGRVRKWFRRLGYDREASRLLARLTTHEGGLPTGAPTSPRLSTLVNRKLDVRLARVAEYHGAVYTRYADDLTFSFAIDDPDRIHLLRRLVRRIAARLRAVEHRALLRQRDLPVAAPTLKPEELAGWQALRTMVERSSRDGK